MAVLAPGEVLKVCYLAAGRWRSGPVPAQRCWQVDGRYHALRAEVLKGELVVLRAVRFDAAPEMPHPHLAAMALQLPGRGVPEDEARAMTRVAWALANDLHHLAMCAQHPPQHLAAAALAAAASTLELRSAAEVRATDRHRLPPPRRAQLRHGTHRL